MNTISVETINSRMRQDRAAFTAQTDAAFSAQLRAIAGDIRAHAAERPVILLAGPSGSGKTTSARMLEAILDGWGCETHTLSMDNYFSSLNDEQVRLMEAGKMDLESPGRLDKALLNRQLEDIAACRPVELPRYDFTAAKQVPSGVTLRRKPGELVILEGIHALNPEVIALPDAQVCRIYVSVRTRVTVDGAVLHPAYIRLVRRMLRDRLHRGRSFAETVRMFESVQHGENRYIMPYKHHSTYDVDTFQAYELSAYSALCGTELREFGRMEGMATLEKALEALDPLPEGEVPAGALIREFIGNSLFTD